MTRKLIILLVVLCSSTVVVGAAHPRDWARCYNETTYDAGTGVTRFCTICIDEDGDRTIECVTY